MTGKPPRASTKSDAKRTRPRGSTQNEKSEKAEKAEKAEKGRAGKLRSPSVVPTDQFLRITDDEIVEVMESDSHADGADEDGGPLQELLGSLKAEVEAEAKAEADGMSGGRSDGVSGGQADGGAGGRPAGWTGLSGMGGLSGFPVRRDVKDAENPLQLRMLVLETASHLSTAQGAVVAAGHVVVRGASGPAGIEKLIGEVGQVDALLVALPGGEPLIDAALALGPTRPVVIAAATASAIEGARRAAGAGADLVVVRPHDVERVAPILFAAARLAEARRQLAAHGHGAAGGPGAGDGAGLDGDLADGLAGLDDEGDGGGDTGALQSSEVFRATVERELERALRYAYPLSVALFGLEIAPPPPPPGVRGILRARTGNALVNAVRDIDRVTELEHDRFLVLMPYTDRLAAAEVARRILSAVAAADPVVAAGRSYPPKVIGAVVGIRPGEPQTYDRLLHDATQLLEQTSVTGASLAVEA
ncbi:MAG TPA: hypothetical protein VH165_27775 [Kofleriaceae bacterium]|nr:hypothetical protein [Kofleriaceae bacterium]